MLDYSSFIPIIPFVPFIPPLFIPELFQYSGNYHPCLSDHALIYGALKQKINLNKPKIINFRSFKNFDSELFKRHLDMAPWHIIQLFDEVDDQVHA